MGVSWYSDAANAGVKQGARRRNSQRRQCFAIGEHSHRILVSDRQTSGFDLHDFLPSSASPASPAVGGALQRFFDLHYVSFTCLHAAEQHEPMSLAPADVGVREQGYALPAPWRLSTIPRHQHKHGAAQRRYPLAWSGSSQSVPHGHWKTITFVAGLRHDGIVAPFLIDGAMNGPIFLAYIEQCLAPTLGRRDIVIMDNLPAHKVAGVIEAIEALGASVLYLPSYSPDLNPIEQFFSKLKALLRQAAERTIPNLCRRIRLLLRTVCPEECANFLRHAGYVST